MRTRLAPMSDRAMSSIFLLRAGGGGQGGGSEYYTPPGGSSALAGGGAGGRAGGGAGGGGVGAGAGRVARGGVLSSGRSFSESVTRPTRKTKQNKQKRKTTEESTKDQILLMVFPFCLYSPKALVSPQYNVIPVSPL